MDPSQTYEQENDLFSLANLPNQSVIIVSGTGEIHLQLEGTHTTSTETENTIANSNKEKKNVKFEDEKKAVTPQNSDTSSKEEREQKEQESDNKNDFTGDVLEISNGDVKESLSSLDSSEFKQIGQENKEIAERFKQIMEMFENFSKNLENLDLETTKQNQTPIVLNISSMKRERPKSFPSRENIKKPRHSLDENVPVHKTGEYKGTALQDISKETRIELLKTEPEISSQKIETPFTVSMSTNTSSCDFSFAIKPSQNSGSQTIGSDHYSVNDLSLLEVSSITSHSEAPNSLNNYAQAENALEISKPPQTPPTTSKSLKVNFQETLATSFTEAHKNWEPLSQVVVEQPTNQNVHTIHIETNAIPSLSDLRRQPLCQRLWSVMGDFCAATFLCLQVNRDCIFCLGFFAAFVVSASFLTAFFYHTLSVSPSIWQATDNLRL